MNQKRTLTKIHNDIGYLRNRVQDVTKSVEHVSKDVKHVSKGVKHILDNVEHILDNIDHVLDNIDHLTVWMKQLPPGSRWIRRLEPTNGESANVETALAGALSRLDDIKQFLQTGSFSANE
ncbi:hypothetical protein V8C43DRAFT_310444 [Trichoderma afarasin]